VAFKVVNKQATTLVIDGKKIRFALIPPGILRERRSMYH